MKDFTINNMKKGFKRIRACFFCCKRFDGTRYFLLFGPKKYDTIYNKITYLFSEKSQKSGVTNVISRNYLKH